MTYKTFTIISRKQLSLCLLPLLWSTVMCAQVVDHENYVLEVSNPSPNNVFYLYAGLGVPNSQLEQAQLKHGKTNGGFSIGFGLNPYGKKKSSAILLGLDFTYNYFGRDKTTDPATEVRYKTGYNHYFVGPLLRLYLSNTSPTIPFIDALAGLNVLNARIKEDQNIFSSIDDEEANVIDNNNDSGFSYGIGIGIHNNKTKTDEEGTRSAFTIRIMYMFGERMNYVVRESVTVENNQLSYSTDYTKTSSLQIQLGITLY